MSISDAREFPDFPLLHKHEHDHDSTWDVLAKINAVGRDESIDEHGNWVDEISIISKDNQAAVLYEIAVNHHSPNNTRGYCLELGTFEGGSAAIIGSALRIRPHLSSPLFAVDQAYQSKSKQRWNKLDIYDKICYVIYDDYSFLNYWHLPTRLLLIDSDHEYEPMKRLIPPALKCVSEGGWLVMHDYENGWPGVVRAVNEFLDQQTFYELEVFLTESLLCIRKDKTLV